MMHLTKLKNRLKLDFEFKLEFEAIGTKWVIGGESGLATAEILSAVTELIESFDKHYSRFRSDSLVYKMSKKVGKYKLPVDSKVMLDLYQKLYQLSGGKFTPLIGNALVETGYDDKYSFKVAELSKVPKWEEVLEYDFPNLIVKKPVVLDFGGIGKGYLIDLISGLFLKLGIKKFWIDGGGDIYSNGEAIRIGLEHPENFEQVIGVVEIKNKSIAASSGNRRKWGKFHHIIDPDNLESPREILATWVIADNAITADSLATCLFLVSPEKLKTEFNFEYLILYPDYSLKKSPDFPGELFLG